MRVAAFFATGALATREDQLRPEDARLPSLVDLFPAADWPQREAHDLYGIEFTGAENLPLVDHVADPAAWITQVSGEEVHQVAVGPVHAGVIESGHFRFQLVGERVIALDLRLFYKHRGIEKLAVGLDPQRSLALAGRICASSNVSLQVALARAWEQQLNSPVSTDAQRLRTAVVEMERLYNHLNDLSAICAGVGYAAGTVAFAALKERSQRLNHQLTGHRFCFGAIEIGGVSFKLEPAEADAVAEEVAAIGRDAAASWRELLFTASVQDRLHHTGVVDRDAARRLGLVGPAARSSGLERDHRAHPGNGLLYPADFEAVMPEDAGGDVAARTEQRALEIEQTVDLLIRLFKGEIEPEASLDRAGGESTRRDERAAGRPVLVRVEGPRGEIVCALEVDQGRVARLHFRTASYANWPALPYAVIGDIIADFPLVNKSFELSYAAVDR